MRRRKNKPLRLGLLALMLLGVVAHGGVRVPVRADDGMSVVTHERIARFRYADGEPLWLQMMDLVGHPDVVLYCVSPYHTGPYAGDPVSYADADPHDVYDNTAFLLGAQAIIEHGYPSTCSYGGVSFDPLDAQYATNVAIWWLHTELGLPIAKPPRTETLPDGHDALFAYADMLFEKGKQQSLHKPALQIDSANWVYDQGRLTCWAQVHGTDVYDIRIGSSSPDIEAVMQRDKLVLSSSNMNLLRGPSHTTLNGYSLFSSDSLFWVAPDDPAYQSMAALHKEPRLSVSAVFNPGIQTGEIRVVKTEPDGTLITEGTATFRLLDAADNTAAGFTNEGAGSYSFGGSETDLQSSGGYLALTGVPEAASGWLLQEVGAPEGYLCSDEAVPVVPGSPLAPAIPFVNEYEMVQITVIKEDRDGGATPAGEAEFGGARFAVWNSLYPSYDEAPEGYRAIVEIPAGGDRVTTGLLHGGSDPAFCVQEIGAPEGYLLTPDVHVCSPEDGDKPMTATVAVKNDVVTGRIRIAKSGEVFSMDPDETGTQRPLSDVPFIIRSERSGSVVDSVTTNAKGVAETGPLPYGHYLVEEQSGPGNSGYTLNEPIPVSISDDGETVCLNLENRAIRTALTIRKIGSDAEDILAGAVFSVLDAEGTPVSWGDPDHPDERISEVATGPDGLATLPVELVPGSYTVVERKAPQGYVINEDPIPVVVDGSGVPLVLDIQNERLPEPVVIPPEEIPAAPPIPATGEQGDPAVWAGGGLLAIGSVLEVFVRIRRRQAA